jgi:hypothetical protein
LGKLFDLPIEAVDQLLLPRSDKACGLTLTDLKLDASGSKSNISIAPGSSVAIHGSAELRRSKLIEVMVGQTTAADGYVLKGWAATESTK